MFSNLYRLRLLDFFELTAATAGALYIYQSVGWHETERYWVVAASSIAAVIIWLATRIGKSHPTPFLYLATYAGALCGLSDLSPWVVLFGRLKIMKAAIWLFPDATPVESWQGRLMTIAVIGGLMIIPALLFSSTWLAGWNVIQRIRSTPTWPESILGRAICVARWTIAAIFLVGVSYYWLRPQIRHASTIRLPITYQAVMAPATTTTATLQAPAISDWTISPKGELLILYCDMRLHRIDPQSHRVVDSRKLNSREHRAFRKKQAGEQLSTVEDDDEDSSEYVHIWQFDQDKLFVSRMTQGENRGTELEIYDLTSSDELLSPKPFVSDETIEDISSDGNFVATQVYTSQFGKLATFKVYDTQTGHCLRTVDRAKHLLRSEYVSVESGSGKLQFPSSGFMCGGFDLPDRRPEFTWAAGTPSATKQKSNDGKFELRDDGLHRVGEQANLLREFWGENVSVMLEPSKNRALLMAGFTLFWNERLGFELPILEHNLHDSLRAQPTLFDAENRSSINSWLRRSSFAGYRSSSPKFTPNGRYFVIRDEDESADLFHVFAMP